jgi:hypothetical protein
MRTWHEIGRSRRLRVSVMRTWHEIGRSRRLRVSVMPMSLARPA